jgi:dTDP-4-amino-4,6-dideoxygalactose transaminase
MIRHQLPVYSPVSLASIAGAALSRYRDEGGARARLSELLLREYAADDVALCGSGTQALQLALETALAQGGKDAVVALPAFSCFDVASAAVGAGCRVTFYDLEPATLAPDQDSLERAFREGARVAVIAVLYGVPVPWDELEACAARHGALLIEDAAQGHGASWRGRRLGSLGRISVLSFGRGKGWTGGGGGALLLRGGIARPERALEPAGAAAGAKVVVASGVQWALGRPSLYGLPRMMPGLRLGETVYHPPVAPREMPERSAALLLATREAAEVEAAARRATAGSLLARLADPSLVRPVNPAPADTPGYLRLPVRIAGGIKGVSSRAPGLRAGIGASYPSSLDRLAPLQERRAGAADMIFPGAQELVDDLLTLPTHSRLTSADFIALDRLTSQYSEATSSRRFSAAAP